MELTKKCNIGKVTDRPGWLLEINYYLAQIYDKREIENTREEFERLKKIIDVKKDTMKNPRSVITSEIVEDKGRICLQLFRNQSLIQTYYIE